MAYKSLPEAIASVRAELEEAKTRVVVLTGQLEVWLEAERLVSKPPETTETKNRAAPRKTTDSVKRRYVRRTKPEKPKRGPKGVWKSIMGELAKINGTFKLPEVEATCKALGLDIKANAVRSQMANYVNAKFVSRVSSGLFKFTDLGRETFGSVQAKDPNPSYQPDANLENAKEAAD